MKKFILPTLVFLIFLSLAKYSYDQDSPKNKELTCKEAGEIVGSKDCPEFAAEQWLLWCAPEGTPLLADRPGSPEPIALYKNLPPSYVIKPDNDQQSFQSCINGGETDEKKEEMQPQGDQATKRSTFDNSVKAITDWINDNLGELDIEAMEARRLYGRTPQMTEEIIKQAHLDWERTTRIESKSESKPNFMADILKGQVQIKLPGQDEWIDLKQGDSIPDGSTIFTGMDATTVLSIEGKGVVQVQSFTEITVSEKGLEQAARDKQTYTDIKLNTGEIEVNIESGVYPGTLMKVSTPQSTTSVRGTHFWVSYSKDKNISTVGVYKGTVEVKTNGSNKFTLVSPKDNQPGAVVISSRFSPLALAVAGLIIIGIIAGTVFFLKKRWGNKLRVNKAR